MQSHLRLNQRFYRRPESNCRTNKFSYLHAMRILHAPLTLSIEIVPQEVSEIPCDIFHFDRNTAGTIGLSQAHSPKHVILHPQNQSDPPA